MTGMYPFSLMPGAFYCSHITRNKVLLFILYIYYLLQPEDTKGHLLVIDEIGTMELLSNGFRTRITEIFRPISECVVLATIPTRRSSPIVESIRNNSEAKVWTVSCSNFY